MAKWFAGWMVEMQMFERPATILKPTVQRPPPPDGTSFGRASSNSNIKGANLLVKPLYLPENKRFLDRNFLFRNIASRFEIPVLQFINHWFLTGKTRL
jgi:hypothetical protein